MSNEDIEPAASLPNEIKDLKREYRGTGIMGPVFWGPCLKHCVKYQRITCYFTSKGLLDWTQALPGLIRGELELIQLVFYQLNDQSDWDAIHESQDPEIARRLREEQVEEVLNLAIFNKDDDQNTAKRQQVLAWLIANHKLELRFAFPKNNAVNPFALMHEKLGIFYFKDGDQVSFMGSPNETYMAGFVNHEAALVFKSWVDKERVEDAKLSFLNTWENKSSGLEVTELSQEMLDRIKVVAPPDRPTIDEESDGSPPEPEEPAGWPHKQAAAEAWFNNNHAGILEMATGTGKTSTAFLIIKRLLKEKTIDRIILTMEGKDLLNQWYEDLLKQKITGKDSPFRRIFRHYGDHRGLNKFVTDSQHATLLISRPQLKDVFIGLEKRGELATTLIVHDEVHELGSASHRKEIAGKHRL